MRKIIPIFLLFGVIQPVKSQNAEYYANGTFLEMLNRDSSYRQLKEKVSAEFAHAKPGHWGEFVKGVDEDIITKQKCIAFTFDACGGIHGDGYDIELIDFLRKENIPVTLFVTGIWIDANFYNFLNLSRDTLFEIENHGLNHKPCAIDGESEYGIHGTANVADAFDEIEANALKIEAITKHKTQFYRSATAFFDEACARIAGELGITSISFQVLSGDAVAFTPYSEIEENVLKNIEPGVIVIMHFNHPEWYTFEAMQKIVPKLRQQGYTFVRLKGFPLKNKYP
jgi:peptidoglycan/xylan/chitin deacetylase (PgdA/CDA1 family)